jgi:glycosyltransferase A (GT-A) superfamily protein (DUF2064 family)
MRITVLAKAPVAGRSKTRLQSRWTPEQAAALAEAALVDTLETVAAVPDVTRTLVLEGRPGSWVPAGFTIRPQVEGDLAARIHAALLDAQEPTLLIGMDTPQLTALDLTTGLAQLSCAEATLGLASDGGWWALGLATPGRHGDLVLGIPTSTDRTGELQHRALVRAGLSVATLRTLRDVDTPFDADAVADLVPTSRFGSLVRSLSRSAA